jgi:hypothetical protein
LIHGLDVTFLASPIVRLCLRHSVVQLVESDEKGSAWCPFVPIDFSRPFYPGPVLIGGLGSVDQCPEKILPAEIKRVNGAFEVT